jgi:NADPH:quinone reductase-like Zn-dependent oxidoreductase
VGGNVQGVAIEYRTFRASAVLPIPEHLYYEEASTIPCAGVTAYAALFENSEPVGPDSEVLTMGTGGVSIWAVQLAKVAGARVIATSSSDNKIETLKQLGSHHFFEIGDY